MGLVKRGDVYWVDLDPALGTEIQKVRPALVLSPDDLNTALPRVIIAPLTSKGRPLGCRPELNFRGRSARILLDQLRCVDKRRLGSRLGEVPMAVWHPTLVELFS